MVNLNLVCGEQTKTAAVDKVRVDVVCGADFTHQDREPRKVLPTLLGKDFYPRSERMDVHLTLDR